MNKYKSVRFNFIMNFILTISNFIFPLITFPYAARILGANGVGTVNFATSIISYFSMIGMMGIPTYGIFICSKVRENKEKLAKTVKEIMILNSIVMVISLILLLLSVCFIPKLAHEKILYLFMSTTLIFNVLGVDWLYKALEKYSYITIRSIVFKFLSLGLLFLLVKSSKDYVFYGFITVFAAVGSNFMNFINLRRLIDFKEGHQLDLRQHLKPVLTFFMLTVSITIYTNLDATMLGFIKNDTEVGYYAAAVKVKQILVSVVTSLGTVLLPRLSYYHAQGKHDEFKQLVYKALNFVFVIAVPLTIYFIIMARDSIIFLSGQKFLPAVLPMQFIMPTVLFIGLSNLTGIQILVPMNRQRIVMISTIFGALVNVVFNAFLIPFVGASGASIATSIAEVIVFLVQLYFLRELVLPMLRKISFWKIIFAVMLASICNFGVLHLLSSIGIFMSLVITAIVFFVIYGFVLLLLKESFMLSTTKSILSKFK